MDACDKGSRVDTDSWGSTITTYYDNSQTPECFTEQINSLNEQINSPNLWLIGGGVVMLLLVIAVIYLLVSNSKKNTEILNLRFNTQNDANSLRELKGRLDKHDKLLNDHSSQISELERKDDIHDGRLMIHFDWIIDLQRQINAVLVVFSDFDRLSPRRGAVLTDLLRAVMDQLTPNKNQSDTNGTDSIKETTVGK